MEKAVIKDYIESTLRHDIESVKRLFASYPSLVGIDMGGNKAIHYAAGYDAVDVAQFLIDKGANLEAKTKLDATTPLDKASSRNSLKVMQLLIDNGADIENGNSECTPLISAIIAGHLEAVKLLIANGAKTDIIFENYGSPMNPLQVANYWGHTDISNYLKDFISVTEEKAVDTDIITEHIEKHVGTVENLSLQQIVGDISLLFVIPEDERRPITVVTKGLSEHAMNTPKGQATYKYAELVMYIPNDGTISPDHTIEDEDMWAFEWLLKAAEYPTRNNSWLGAGSTIIDNEKPLAEDIDYTGLLLLHSPAEFGELKVSEEKTINFLTVFPLFESEIKFERKHGVAKLLQKFQEKRIHTMVTPFRPCVV